MKEGPLSTSSFATGSDRYSESIIRRYLSILLNSGMALSSFQQIFLAEVFSWNVLKSLISNMKEASSGMAFIGSAGVSDLRMEIK
jgi:hypothetical protein